MSKRMIVWRRKGSTYTIRALTPTPEHEADTVCAILNDIYKDRIYNHEPWEAPRGAYWVAGKFIGAGQALLFALSRVINGRQRLAAAPPFIEYEGRAILFVETDVVPRAVASGNAKLQVCTARNDRFLRYQDGDMAVKHAADMAMLSRAGGARVFIRLQNGAMIRGVLVHASVIAGGRADVHPEDRQYPAPVLALIMALQ